MVTTTPSDHPDTDGRAAPTGVVTVVLLAAAELVFAAALVGCALVLREAPGGEAGVPISQARALLLVTLPGSVLTVLAALGLVHFHKIVPAIGPACGTRPDEPIRRAPRAGRLTGRLLDVRALLVWVSLCAALAGFLQVEALRRLLPTSDATAVLWCIAAIVIAVQLLVACGLSLWAAVRGTEEQITFAFAFALTAGVAGIGAGFSPWLLAR